MGSGIVCEILFFYSYMYACMVPIFFFVRSDFNDILTLVLILYVEVIALSAAIVS